MLEKKPMTENKRAYVFLLIADSGEGKTHQLGLLAKEFIRQGRKIGHINTDGGELTIQSVLEHPLCVLNKQVTSQSETLMAVEEARSSGIDLLLLDGLTRPDQRTRSKFREIIARRAVRGDSDARAMLDPTNPKSRELALKAGMAASGPTLDIINKVVDLKLIDGITVAMTAWKGPVTKPRSNKHGKMEFVTVGVGAWMSAKCNSSAQYACDCVWYLDRVPSDDIKVVNGEEVRYKNYADLTTIAYTRPSFRQSRNCYVYAKTRSDPDRPETLTPEDDLGGWRNPDLGAYFRNLIGAE